MTFKLQIPQIGLESKSTKDLIINILSTEWPLTLKQIYYQIKKAGRSITYQAVHKAAQELLNNRIITKQEKQYLLDEDYIKQLKEFGETLESIYQKKKTRLWEILDKNGFVSLKFETQIDVGKFIIDLLDSTVAPDDTTIYLWSFMWPPTCLSKKEYAQVRRIVSIGKHLCLCQGHTTVDKIFAQMWKRVGIKVKLGINYNSLFETFIHKDLIIQVYAPMETRKAKGWETIKSLAKLNIDRFYQHTILKKIDHDILIIKNPELADKIRKEALELFAKNDL